MFQACTPPFRFIFVVSFLTSRTQLLSCTRSLTPSQGERWSVMMASICQIPGPYLSQGYFGQNLGLIFSFQIHPSLGPLGFTPASVSRALLHSAPSLSTVSGPPPKGICDLIGSVAQCSRKIRGLPIQCLRMLERSVLLRC